MKVALSLSLPAALLLLARLVPGEEPASKASPAPEGFRPGPQHALLGRLAGTWDAILIVKDAGGAEVRTRGTLTTERHADFHTVDRFEGAFLGMKMVGHGMNGYCTVRKQYFRFWTDSMSPAPMTLLGDYDAGKRELTLKGQCLGRSGALEACRTVTRLRDDDHVEWTLFGAGPDGKEAQILRIEYTRKA
jgi:hypothetical protein